VDLRENFLRRLIAILGLAALAVLEVDPMLLSSSVLVCTLMVDSVAELSVVGDGILFIAPEPESLPSLRLSMNFLIIFFSAMMDCVV